MPAMLDDPNTPVIYRTSGDGPHLAASDPLPSEIQPRQVTLRDRITQATLVPFSSAAQVPRGLIDYLCSQLNKEIEKGDTYPMTNPMTADAFGNYWFANFGAVMLLGEIRNPIEVLGMAQAGCDWEKQCLGSFYIKPNYPGRSSHVCNGGFLVTDGSRNRGVGRLMGEGYLDYAPKLGYSYSVFNLVYETNTPSCRIWDALGFKRIGRVKGCGNLKSYPGQLIDAIIYGRDLGTDDSDLVSEERFERIKFYLKHGRYPDGADRAEKSRLRSASTHYKLIPATDDEPEKLVLKGKEVVSDPQRQYDVAWRVHSEHHGGINKTTATITERYHWVRIKDTVTQVIKNCAHCKEAPQRAIAPYGRREVNLKQTTLHPFDREFSIPPGERSLWVHGYGPDGVPLHDPQGEEPTTPKAPEDEPHHVAEKPHETSHTDATFGALMAAADAMMPSFPEFPHDDDSVPVDPEIMNGEHHGIMPTHFQQQLEDEVRRMQKSQVFGTPIFEPRDSRPVGHPSGHPVNMGNPNSALMNARASRGQASAQQALMYVPDSGIPPYSEAKAPSLHRQGPATPAIERKRRASGQEDLIGNSELRRVTRRLAANSAPNEPQPGHMSEDAWRRSLNG